MQVVVGWRCAANYRPAANKKERTGGLERFSLRAPRTGSQKTRPTIPFRGRLRLNFPGFVDIFSAHRDNEVSFRLPPDILEAGPSLSTFSRPACWLGSFTEPQLHFARSARNMTLYRDSAVVLGSSADCLSTRTQGVRCRPIASIMWSLSTANQSCRAQNFGSHLIPPPVRTGFSNDGLRLNH
jgi:hypothetical protein